MKAIKWSLFVWSVFTLLAFSSCADDMQSIDLSHITFDGVSVGDRFNRINTGNYTVSTRYPEDENTYNYEEWRISVDRGIITKITASFGAIHISVNGREDCDNIADIVRVLGEEYHASDYDAEQGLMQLRYRDKMHGIQCRFVFDKNTDLLVWGIAEKS